MESDIRNFAGQWTGMRHWGACIKHSVANCAGNHNHGVISKPHKHRYVDTKVHPVYSALLPLVNKMHRACFIHEQV